jgi:hypothetical protein
MHTGVIDLLAAGLLSSRNRNSSDNYIPEGKSYHLSDIPRYLRHPTTNLLLLPSLWHHKACS